MQDYVVHKNGNYSSVQDIIREYIYIYNLSFDEGIPQENVDLKSGPHPVVKQRKVKSQGT